MKQIERDLQKCFEPKGAYVFFKLARKPEIRTAPLVTSIRTLDASGQLHSFDDKPAIISRKKHSKQALVFEWYTNGVLHRDNGPAVIMTFTSGLTRSYWWHHGVPKRRPA